MTGRVCLRQLGIAFWHCRIALLYAAAYVWRRVLVRTTFIAITGSKGKTTAKECLAGALQARYPTGKTLGNQNGYDGVPRSVLRVRPWHRFAVIEVAAKGRGLVKRSARLVRPDVAIVLLVARNHMKDFRTLENVAAEKAELLAHLGPRSIAVLNGDDPRVAAMAESLKQRVVFFGSSPSFPYWADAATSKWPERLSFDLHAGAERAEVRTRLVGCHWRHAVLGALAAAHVCGMTLRDAVMGVREVEPVLGRMQPVQLPSGAMMIRDDLDGSLGASDAAFETLAGATAERKILIMTDVTDTSMSPRQRYRTMGRAIARIFDLAVFIGDRAGYGVRGAIAGGMSSERARACFSWQQAEDFLAGELKQGDLVLLRGRVGDHLARLYFALLGPVACRKTLCRKQIICDLCPELGALSPPRAVPAPATHIILQPQSGSTPAEPDGTSQSPAARC